MIAADIEKRRARAIEDHAAAVEKAAAAAEEEYRRTCLDATTGHIACISAAFGDDQLVSVRNVVLHRFGDVQKIPPNDVLDGERRMLERFFNYLTNTLEEMALDRCFKAWNEAHPVELEDGRWQINASPDGAYINVVDKAEYLEKNLWHHRQTPTIVAHHAQFDVRYIWQRAIILGVAVPAWWPIDARPWDSDRIDDTMIAWAGAKGTIGLDRLCRALGIPGKPDDIDGSKVWDAVREGRIDDVVRYCDGDVERLRAVHRRIRGIPSAAAEAADAEISVADALFEAASAAADRDHGAGGEAA